MNDSGGASGMGLGTMVYLLQGFGFTTPSVQREELVSLGIGAGEASAHRWPGFWGLGLHAELADPAAG